MAFGYLYMASFVVSLLLIFLLYKVRQSELGVFLIVITALTAFWLLMKGASFFVDNTSLIIIFQKLKYISIIIVPATMLMTCYVFTHSVKSLTPLKIVLIYLIPIISFVSILTQFPYPFITNTFIEYEKDIPLFFSDRQLGFYVHTAYSYVAILLSNILLFYRSIKLPAIYRNQSLFLFMGSFASVFINMIYLTGIVGKSMIDTTPITILITLLAFYWGIYILPRNKLVTQARNLVIENMADMVIILDFKRNIIDVNPAAKVFFGDLYMDLEESNGEIFNYVGVSLEKVLKSLHFDEDIHEAIISGENKDIMLKRKGSSVFFQLRYQPIIDHEDSQIGELYSLNDVSKLQNNVNKLMKANEALEVSDQIISDAREAIIITDANNRIIKANQSMVTMSGYSMEEMIGQDPKMLQSKQHEKIFYRDMWDAILRDGFWQGEILDRRKNGEEYPKWMSITVIKNLQGDISRYISISSDITRIKRAEEEVHRLAYYDDLTGLPNRTLFNERLSTALSRANRKSKLIALMFIDLDRFKEINDTYGHAAGDKVLTIVSERIKARIRSTDTLSRLGGDEFTLILEDLDNPQEAETVAKAIIEVLQEPLDIGITEVKVMISIGITIGPDDGISEEGLLRRADLAMYHSKEIDGNQFFFSSKAIEQKKQKQQQLSLALKEAVSENQFELYLQAQISKGNQGIKVVGAEALIRWPQADGTMISPYEFIEVAEKNGSIHDIGLWVIEEVHRMNVKLREKGIVLDLALNVSVRQFENSKFIAQVTRIIHQYKDVPINLTIEITESMFFRELEKAISDLEALKALGISIALDDFGTGFSSMSYLNRLPLDYIKIDKSFVDEIEPDNRKNLAFMILSMAQTLDFKTVAEGIEKKHQADRLFKAGCDIIQGYYYAKPMPLQGFIDYVTSIEKLK